MQHYSKGSDMSIDIYDEAGIGSSTSGVSGGLLHPYSPKAKLLWKGSDSWKECLELLAVAQRAMERNASAWETHDQSCSFDGPIVLRRADLYYYVSFRGILKPATTEMKVETLMENAKNCLTNCPLEAMDEHAAKCLAPNIIAPAGFAIYMPLAMNIHPKRYLQALFLACQNFADEASSSANAKIDIRFHEKHVNTLLELGGDYDAVVVCLGAKVGMLPELSGNLPLRACRGVIAQLELPTNIVECCINSPSILSDAWLAFQGPRSLLMGSTWDWGSKNYSPRVLPEEASKAVSDLLPKASAVFPTIKKWEFVKARAGIRAMPPSTAAGSLPLLGCVDTNCRYWLVGGLGSRGLLYHGLLGKLIAQAVISDDEAVIPSELTSWKRMAIWKQN
ncbi:hypothetical protein AXF42_Ash005847 [Apostasia shenzhenica]|uniref:FAD dependent oxidoreductase domain-containing protein n=1 Tax=Apostasia shenzhenica TaxID=1088818 RepID=A0A2I0BCJ0_9ASPA|nr:hypothetical protein AXF42_Ash005847 [Apostasia shenzhenica]